MKLEKKRFADVVLLKFVGEFDTFNLPMFSERVDRMLNAGDVFYVLDVRLLTFINSSALGYLIKMSKRVMAPTTLLLSTTMRRRKFCFRNKPAA